jgi:hypothetical protein
MQFSTISITLSATTAFAIPGCSNRDEASALITRVINNGRPVATGTCCIANTSKKGDTCKLSDGTADICASANTAGCQSILELPILQSSLQVEKIDFHHSIFLTRGSSMFWNHRSQTYWTFANLTLCGAMAS